MQQGNKRAHTPQLNPQLNVPPTLCLCVSSLQLTSRYLARGATAPFLHSLSRASSASSKGHSTPCIHKAHVLGGAQLGTA